MFDADHPDPLAAFIHGPTWREEAIPALRRMARKLEQAAIQAPTMERLLALRAEHALITRIADPGKLLGMIRSRANSGATAASEDDPLADLQGEELD